MGQGPFELERRYLVRMDPALWACLGEGRHFVQGYVKTGDPSVRIRTGEARGPVLTLKSGDGVRRREVETVVSEDVAEALLEASGTRVLEKVRFVSGPWELDRFLGHLEGMTLMELELEREDDAIPTPPSGVEILREVTNDNAMTNSALAGMTEELRAPFVHRLYGDGAP